jgi:hypothetical protein
MILPMYPVCALAAAPGLHLCPHGQLAAADDKSRSLSLTVSQRAPEPPNLGAGETGAGHGHARADPADLRCALAVLCTAGARVQRAAAVRRL